MIEKIKRHKGLLRLSLMIVLSCMLQVISLMKSSVVAGRFGVTSAMDSFNFANSIATFIFSFVIAGVSTVVIPCYVKRGNRKYTDAFLTAIFIGITAIAALVLLLRIPLITVITGRNVEFVKLAGNIMVILICSNWFSVFTSVTSAYFQYAEKYNIPKVISLIMQLGVVLLLIFNTNISVLGYAGIVGAGIILNSLMDIIFAVKSGWRYKPVFSVKDTETRKLLKMFAPILLSTGVYQISLMVDSAIASRLNTGDISVLNYANQISSMVNTLLVNNLLVYFYPKLVQDIENNREQNTFWEKTYFFHAVMCLVSAGFAVIGHEGISVLFEHGEFHAQATETVFVLSLIYISGLQFNVIRDLIYRYFYSCSDTKSPTMNSIMATLVNIVTSLILVKFIGIYGIVIGTVVASIISMISIMVRFKIQFDYEKKVEHIIFQYIKTVMIMLGTVFLTEGTKCFFHISNKIVSILVFGVEVVLIYIVLTMIFNRKLKDIVAEI